MENSFQNTALIQGSLSKMVGIRTLTKQSKQATLVLESRNHCNEPVFLRLVAFEDTVVEKIQELALNAGDFVRIEAVSDVVKWVDIKSNVRKSRQSLIVVKIEKL